MPHDPDTIAQMRSATGAAIAELERTWAPSISLTIDQQSDYYALPLLLLDAFPPLRPADIQPLALFCRLYAGSIFLQDRLVDGALPLASVPEISLRVMAMQVEAYRVLHGLFPPSAAFWGHFHEDLAEYANACVEERRFAERKRPLSEYTDDVGIRIALGKNAPARSIASALAELAPDEERRLQMVSIIDDLNRATQLWDDLQDWKEDLRSGRPSVVIARIVPEMPGPMDTPHEKALIAAAARELFYGGHAADVLDMILRSLDGAEQMKRELPELGLHAMTASLRARCEALRCDVTRIVRENIERARTIKPAFPIPTPENPYQALAADALRFLARQALQGYGEARDQIVYPKQLGFGDGVTCYRGDVFQRALVADAFADANRWLNGGLGPLLARESEYLLSQRMTDGIGGFRYFVNLPELPPDSDVLGQVIQVLVRAGRHEDVAKYCELSLSVLLRDGTHSDGSFETWIVPAVGRSPLEARQAELLSSVWSYGPDCDVIPNLLFALLLYDRGRFDGVIRRGAAWLARAQRPDGTWPSRWYKGPYYAIHVCMRLLSALAPGAPAVASSLAFLRQTQRSDGGFGLDGRPSDPLSTSLALLALAEGQLSGVEPADHERAARARSFLAATCDEGDGGFPAHELIFKGIGAFHGSRTYTALFALKAALAWDLQSAPARSALPEDRP